MTTKDQTTHADANVITMPGTRQVRGAYKQKTSSRGGARPGAGRPKGSTNKITMDGLLQSLNKNLGRDYAEQIAENYAHALNRGDYAGVRDYDKVLLGKIIADRQHVETVDSTEAAQEKAAVFAEALKAMGGSR